MLHTIVWATDGSETADTALPLVVELARAGSSRVVVVHVTEYQAAMGGPHPVRVNEDELQDKVRWQVAAIQGQGIETQLELRATVRAKAEDVIAQAARDHNAHLVVVGTRGHRPLTGLLVGSVTQRLLNISPCPVLAVPSRLARLELPGALAANAL